jgi:hypothetical protein
MAPSEDGIEHVKLAAGKGITGSPTSRHSDWDIVPDPSSDGGFRLVESSFGDINPAEVPQQGSSSSIIYGNGDTDQENRGNNDGESSKIAGIGMTSGAAVTLGVSSGYGLWWPSSSVLGSGMSSHGVVSTGVSVPSSPQRPSANILGSGMSSPGVVSTGVSVPNSPQRPSANVLGSGMSSPGVVGTGVYIGSGYQIPSASILGEGVGSGDKLPSKGNQLLLHTGQKISQSGQQQFHSVHVSVKNGSSGIPSPSSKTGWRVSAPGQLQAQFLPAAHWHGSPVPVGLSQKSPSVATGVLPAASQHQLSLSPGSLVHTEASSISTL